MVILVSPESILKRDKSAHIEIELFPRRVASAQMRRTARIVVLVYT